ncbi:MAG: zf-HC2 domain-containing protein [Actinomycetota bacterium]|nr:zf-HC2 domain-containing protein [Actinomycetota bacterium]
MAGVTPVSEHLSMLLSCYLDGALTSDELDEVVEALESDQSAVAAFRRLKEARSAIQTLPILDAPLHLLPSAHPGEELSAYLDGELSTMETPVITAHIKTCTECRHELGELDRGRTAVRALPGLESPAFLDLRREEQREQREQRRGLRAAIAVVASVAAVTLAFSFGDVTGEAEPATSVSISELQSRHTAIASIPSSGTAVQISTTP